MTHPQVKIEKVANFGPNEPFVARIVMGLPEVLDTTTYSNKEEIKEAIMEIFMNGLAPAFSSLKEIRKIESGEKENYFGDGEPRLIMIKELAT